MVVAAHQLQKEILAPQRIHSYIQCSSSEFYSHCFVFSHELNQLTDNVPFYCRHQFHFFAGSLHLMKLGQEQLNRIDLMLQVVELSLLYHLMFIPGPTVNGVSIASRKAAFSLSESTCLLVLTDFIIILPMFLTVASIAHSFLDTNLYLTLDR